MPCTTRVMSRGQGLKRVFGKQCASAFSISGSDETLTAAILTRFVLRPRILEAVRALRRRGVLCAILSDQTDWLERLDARDGFFRYFDRVYNSYRMGKGKRDALLFDDVVADLGCKPGQVAFLDDNEGNVERARLRGLKAWRCDSEPGCLDALNALVPHDASR